MCDIDATSSADFIKGDVPVALDEGNKLALVTSLVVKTSAGKLFMVQLSNANRSDVGVQYIGFTAMQIDYIATDPDPQPPITFVGPPVPKP